MKHNVFEQFYKVSREIEKAYILNQITRKEYMRLRQSYKTSFKLLKQKIKKINYKITKSEKQKIRKITNYTTYHSTRINYRFERNNIKINKKKITYTDDLPFKKNKTTTEKNFIRFRKTIFNDFNKLFNRVLQAQSKELNNKIMDFLENLNVEQMFKDYYAGQFSFKDFIQQIISDDCGTDGTTVEGLSLIMRYLINDDDDHIYDTFQTIQIGRMDINQLKEYIDREGLFTSFSTDNTTNTIHIKDIYKYK